METQKQIIFHKSLERYCTVLSERDGKITPKINQNLMKFEIISFARELEIRRHSRNKNR